MKEFVLCVLLVVCLSLVLCSWCFRSRRSTRDGIFVPPPCGCVFDIDGTITCGNPVELCKKMGCVIGINTARPAPWADDISLKNLGFPENVLNLEDFVYNPSGRDIVKQKVDGLLNFQQKWKIRSPKDVLFFDDNLANLEGAAQAGFSTVQCSTLEGCGISEPQVKHAKDFFLSRESVSRERAFRA